MAGTELLLAVLLTGCYEVNILLSPTQSGSTDTAPPDTAGTDGGTPDGGTDSGTDGGGTDGGGSDSGTDGGTDGGNPSPACIDDPTLAEALGDDVDSDGDGDLDTATWCTPELVWSGSPVPALRRGESSMLLAMGGGLADSGDRVALRFDADGAVQGETVTWAEADSASVLGASIGEERALLAGWAETPDGPSPGLHRFDLLLDSPAVEHSDGAASTVEDPVPAAMDLYRLNSEPPEGGQVAWITTCGDGFLSARSVHDSAEGMETVSEATLERGLWSTCFVVPRKEWDTARIITCTDAGDCEAYVTGRDKTGLTLEPGAAKGHIWTWARGHDDNIAALDAEGQAWWFARSTSKVEPTSIFIGESLSRVDVAVTETWGAAVGLATTGDRVLLTLWTVGDEVTVALPVEGVEDVSVEVLGDHATVAIGTADGQVGWARFTW